MVSTLRTTTKSFYGSYISAHPSRTHSISTYQPVYRSGIENPRWHAAVRSGQSATTPYAAEFSDRFLQSCDIKYEATGPGWTQGGATYKEGWAGNTGLVTTPPSYDTGILNAVQSRAVGSLSENVRANLVGFAGPSFLAELLETIAMLRTPGKTLYDNLIALYGAINGYHALHRGQDAFQHLSNAYLQFVYGIRPLYGDVMTAAKAYERLMKPRTLRVYAQATERKNSHSTGSQTLGGKTGLKYERAYQWEAGCRAVVGLKRSVLDAPSVDGFTKAAKAIHSFGFANPQEILLAGYEVIPYSFVVDYFTNLNEILASTYLTQGNIAWSSVTTKQVASVSSQAKGYHSFPTSARVVDSSTSGICNIKQTKFARADSIPPIGLTFHAPSFGQLINLANLANARRPPMR